MLLRPTVEVPGAAPAGRAVAKLPPTYTVLPTTAWVQATPSICAVGSASPATVSGDDGLDGSVGIVSAPAAVATKVSPAVSTATAPRARARAAGERRDSGK